MCWKRRQPHNSEDVTQDCEAFVKEQYFSNSEKEANKKLREKRTDLLLIFFINQLSTKNKTWTWNIWRIQSILQKTLSKTLSNTTQTVWAWWQVALLSPRSWHRNILATTVPASHRSRGRDTETALKVEEIWREIVCYLGQQQHEWIFFLFCKGGGKIKIFWCFWGKIREF